MPNKPFDFDRLTPDDHALAHMILGTYRVPDLDIRPNGEEYLYRWHIVRDRGAVGVYFHIQMASDPERPLHDHPWDNTSVILAGGYEEILHTMPERGIFDGEPFSVTRHKGDVIYRPATWAHRLILPAGVPYTMSLFTTGPKVRDWGFWYPEGWRSFEQVTRTKDGVSVHLKDGEMV